MKKLGPSGQHVCVYLGVGCCHVLHNKLAANLITPLCLFGPSKWIFGDTFATLATALIPELFVY